MNRGGAAARPPTAAAGTPPPSYAPSTSAAAAHTSASRHRGHRACRHGEQRRWRKKGMPLTVGAVTRNAPAHRLIEQGVNYLRHQGEKLRAASASRRKRRKHAAPAPSRSAVTSNQTPAPTPASSTVVASAATMPDPGNVPSPPAVPPNPAPPPAPTAVTIAAGTDVTGLYAGIPAGEDPLTAITRQPATLHSLASLTRAHPVGADARAHRATAIPEPGTPTPDPAIPDRITSKDIIKREDTDDEELPHDDDDEPLPMTPTSPYSHDPTAYFRSCINIVLMSVSGGNAVISPEWIDCRRVLSDLFADAPFSCLNDPLRHQMEGYLFGRGHPPMSGVEHNPPLRQSDICRFPEEPLNQAWILAPYKGDLYGQILQIYDADPKAPLPTLFQTAQAKVNETVPGMFARGGPDPRQDVRYQMLEYARYQRTAERCNAPWTPQEWTMTRAVRAVILREDGRTPPDPSKFMPRIASIDGSSDLMSQAASSYTRPLLPITATFNAPSSVMSPLTQDSTACAIDATAKNVPMACKQPAHPNAAGKPAADATSLTEVKDAIDRRVEGLSKPWKGHVPFECFVVPNEKADIATVLSGRIQKIDIADYLNGGKWPVTRLYFNPQKYPPPPRQREKGVKLEQVSPGWVALSRDLIRSAHKNGAKLSSNGSVGKNKDERRITCGHRGRGERKTTAMPVTEEYPYRETSLQADRKNNREGGQYKSKRVKIEQDGADTCKFKILLKWDAHGFYVSLERYAGWPLHTHHPQPFDPTVIPFPTRLLTADERKGIVGSVKATSSKAAGRNAALTNHGLFLNDMKVGFLNKSKNDKNAGLRGDIARMMESFKSSGDIKFTTLSNMPMSKYADPATEEKSYQESDHVTVCTQKTDGNEISSTNVDSIPGIENLAETAEQERKQRKMRPMDTLFICVAWVKLSILRFFLCCPEVIWCDVTSHSNNKGFHLLTFSCRTSIAKQVVFLWVWLPNQQRFSFRWIFQFGVSCLIPAMHRARVRLVMKDGDPQQRNEILVAFKMVFVRAIEGGCGVHIMSFGWKAHVPGSRCISKRGRKKWGEVVGLIHSWVYSWMKPGYVKDADEYELSKFLLMKFVCSTAVLSAAEGKQYIINAIIGFLRGYVFVYEELYLFYKKKHIRHYGVWCSSEHEGTNLGLKDNASAIAPTMNMDTAADAINLQQDVKGKQLEESVYLDYQNKNKRWSSSLTAKHTTTMGEGLAVKVNNRGKLYMARRIGIRKFQSWYIGDADTVIPEMFVLGEDDETKKCPIPQFHNVYNVTLDINGVMQCDCCNTEWAGMYCEQMVAVANLVYDAVGLEFPGFTHHDMAIRYNSAYMHMAWKDSTPEDIRAAFEHLAMNDVVGPRLRIPIPGTDVLPIHDPMPHQPAVERLKNYSAEEINVDGFDGMFTQTFTPGDTDLSDEESDAFEGMATALSNATTESGEAVFKRAVDALGTEAGNTRCRDELKQTWEENCEIADEFGVRGVQKLDELMSEFKTWANEQRYGGLQEHESRQMGDKNDNDDGDMVPMTHTSYKGTASRVHNSWHMPQSSSFRGKTG